MRSATKKHLTPITTARAATPARGRGRSAAPARTERLSKKEGAVVFRNLATLCGNGVSLPKALGALAEERALERRRGLLADLRRRIEGGDSFSAALAHHASSFDKVTVSQVRVGERAGMLADTLNQIADQREKSGKIREEVLKKLAYPIVLATMGSGVVAFLLGYVVPVFQKTYESAHVPLPGITRSMILIGEAAQNYWWAAILAIVLTLVLVQQLRRSERAAHAMDAHLLRIPLIGPWVRDIALLQLMEVIGSLMEAGFTLAEALAEASDSVANRAMKIAVGDLRRAVQHGERFSREVERHADLFPPMVSQLVIVGEQTGKLTTATRHIRDYLQEEIRRKSDVAIGVIEPTLTLGMAGAVAVILLAIYLPMFDMINTVGK